MTYLCLNRVEDVEHRELSYSEISSTSTRDLCDLVSYMVRKKGFYYFLPIYVNLQCLPYAVANE